MPVFSSLLMKTRRLTSPAVVLTMNPHRLLHKAGLLRKNKNGGYELRVHSIRKFFKTQLQSLGVADCYIDLWMGHKTSVYSDLMMKGVEFHRDLYSKAGLCIKPQTTGSKADLLKQMVESIGASPDEVREALHAKALQIMRLMSLQTLGALCSASSERSDRVVEARVFSTRVQERCGLVRNVGDFSLSGV